MKKTNTSCMDNVMLLVLNNKLYRDGYITEAAYKKMTTEINKDYYQKKERACS